MLSQARQDKPVFVRRLVTLRTIEEKMLELQRRKGAVAEGLFDPEAGGALDITADNIELLLAAQPLSDYAPMR